MEACIHCTNLLMLMPVIYLSIYYNRDEQMGLQMELNSSPSKAAIDVFLMKWFFSECLKYGRRWQNQNSLPAFFGSVGTFGKKTIGSFTRDCVTLFLIKL